MQKLPKVTLSPVFHNKEHQIKIAFAYNEVLLAIIRDLPKARWSKTLRSWYIKNTSENLKLVLAVFTGEAVIHAASILDTSMPMHQFPKRRIRTLSLDNKNLLNGFYKYLTGKRYSQSTINTYSFFAADFIEFNNTKPLETLTNRDVELFIETVFIKRKYAINTQRQFISAIKLFTVYFPDTQIENIELTRPHRSRILPTVLSQQEMILIISNTHNIKHRAILALIYSAGLRISELINLKIEDLNINRKQIYIKNSKGRKDRYVILAESFLPLLRNYLISYKPTLFFVEGPKQKQYTASSVRKFLAKSCKISNIKKTVTPHTLRHSYATHLLESGVGLRHIQELLGHSKPETTMIYTHVAKKDLLEIKSPLDLAIAQLSKNQNQEQKFLLSGE